MPKQPIPVEFLRVCHQLGILPSRYALVVIVAQQILRIFIRARTPGEAAPGCLAGGESGGNQGPFFLYEQLRTCRISTSRFGLGQQAHSNRTPLGLHRIAEKIGGGHPIGTVFEGRKPAGLTWQGKPSAAIAHRILWLEGLELGLNRGPGVDSFSRYIYLHGVGDETTLGRPASRGCVHLAAADLLPLYDRLPRGTLVWVTER